MSLIRWGRIGHLRARAVSVYMTNGSQGSTLASSSFLGISWATSTKVTLNPKLSSKVGQNYQELCFCISAPISFFFYFFLQSSQIIHPKIVRQRRGSSSGLLPSHFPSLLTFFEFLNHLFRTGLRKDFPIENLQGPSSSLSRTVRDPASSFHPSSINTNPTSSKVFFTRLSRQKAILTRFFLWCSYSF